MKQNKLRSDFADEWFRKIEDAVYLKKKIEEDHGIKMQWIKILDDKNEFNKQKGDYITLEFSVMNDSEERNMISSKLKEILELLTEKINLHKILIVGLGNEAMISDAIGPRTINQIIVTAHLFENKDRITKGIGHVAAISPNVMGQTGLESSRIVKGICDFYHPDLIICVDALATDCYSRINRVIQISNTGITPGSGVGNHRLAIDQSTMNVPVISIGVATVTTIRAIVQDVMKEHVDMDDEVLECIVTPRSIDVECAQIVSILSLGINQFVHPSYDKM